MIFAGEFHPAVLGPTPEFWLGFLASDVFVPKGQVIIAQRFSVGEPYAADRLSPEGTTERRGTSAIPSGLITTFGAHTQR